MKIPIPINLRAAFSTILAFALCTVGIGVMTRPVRAFSVLTVTSTADSGPGSLRDAVAGSSSGDTITFNVSLPAVITLTSGEIAIAKTITIIGPGAAVLKISGNSSSRIFEIGAAGNLTISGISIANGSISSATLVGDITNTGGGIYNTGTISATNCLFIGNHASIYGGAVENHGSAAFTECSFSGNSAIVGGAINNEIPATLPPGTFPPTMFIVNCDFNGNTASDGGAISNVAPLSINNTTFSGNSSLADGGAILNSWGLTVPVTNTTFSNNIAGTCKCGIGNGGAVDNIGLATFSNCTFGGNSADASGGAIRNKHIGLGGINPTSGLLTLTNCTISGNSAPSGGGVFGTGGTNTGTLSLHNTIVAHSTGGDCVKLGLTGTNSHNLIQDGSCSPLLSGDPMVGPLFPNGGPTDTMALLAGSPAIDAGDNTVRGAPLLLLADQRGVPRCHVDIGAYEFAEPAVPPPTVICPGNITVPNDPGSPSAAVSFAATANDFCDGQIAPIFKIGSSVITSPHTFAAGTTTVTAYATDLLHITGMCSFTVTVTALDTCIQDDHTGDTFRFSSQTGAYVYTRCKDKFTLSGTGSVKTVNNVVWLADSLPDRKVSTHYSLGQLTGMANVTLIIGPGIYQPITVFQTNPHPTCVCP